MSRRIVALGLSFALISCAAPKLDLKLDVGGHRLRCHLDGRGSPVVVFDSGMGDTLEVWDSVRPAVARFTAVVVYDRAGIGRSDPGPAPRTSRRIARELHALLSEAGVEPPYVLVGHSFGALNVLAYAAEYSEEVAGLVLVEPTPPDYPGREQELHPAEDHRRLASSIDAAPPAIKQERAAIAESIDQARGARPGPDLPVIVLSASRRGEHPGFRRAWTTMQTEFAREIRATRHLFAENSGHHIHADEPELVIEAIREVVETVRNGGRERRSVSAISH